jgi:hypothetical protein
MRVTLALSAEGAKYDSQGQALSEAMRVAPGKEWNNDREALKERNNSQGSKRYFALSVLSLEN